MRPIRKDSSHHIINKTGQIPSPVRANSKIIAPRIVADNLIRPQSTTGMRINSNTTENPLRTVGVVQIIIYYLQPVDAKQQPHITICGHCLVLVDHAILASADIEMPYKTKLGVGYSDCFPFI